MTMTLADAPCFLVPFLYLFFLLEGLVHESDRVDRVLVGGLDEPADVVFETIVAR